MYFSYSYGFTQASDINRVPGARLQRFSAVFNPNSYLHDAMRVQETESISTSTLKATVTSSCIVGLATSTSNTHSRLHVNTLPTEILTAIFILCLPRTQGTSLLSKPYDAFPSPPSPATAPLLLCHVCSYWRRLARATPFLWTELNLGEVRPGKEAPLCLAPVEIIGGVDREVVHSAPRNRESPFGVVRVGISSLCTHASLDTSTPLSGSPERNEDPRSIGPSTYQSQTTTITVPVYSSSSRASLQKTESPSNSNPPALARLYASLSSPLPLRRLQILVSRYRFEGVKTDRERYDVTVITPRSASRMDGDISRGVQGHNVECEVNEERDEDGGTIEPRALLEAIFFKRGALVARRVEMLHLTLDSLDDLPRVPILISNSPIPLPLSNTLPPRSLQCPASLHTLNAITINMPHLTLFDFEWTPWMPIYLQLRDVVGRMAGARVSPEGGEGGDDGIIPSGMVGRRSIVFALPDAVPGLRKVELDVPWITLIPGHYTPPRHQSSAERPRVPPVAPLASASLSLVPFPQLTSLILTRAVPLWVFRALLVECVALKTVVIRLLAFDDTTDPQQNQHPVIPGGVGGGVGPGGPVVVWEEKDWGLNRECYRGFGGDPVVRALDESGAGDRARQGQEGDLDDDRSWTLSALEELHLTLRCNPDRDERALVGRLRRVEEERFPVGVHLGRTPIHLNLRNQGVGVANEVGWSGAVSQHLSDENAKILEFSLRGLQMPRLRRMEVHVNT